MMMVILMLWLLKKTVYFFCSKVPTSSVSSSHNQRATRYRESCGNSRNNRNIMSSGSNITFTKTNCKNQHPFPFSYGSREGWLVRAMKKYKINMKTSENKNYLKNTQHQVNIFYFLGNKCKMKQVAGYFGLIFYSLQLNILLVIIYYLF